MSILQQTSALGQQIWLDNLSRSLMQSGELAVKIKQGIKGVTTNPAIFLNAIGQDTAYLPEIAELKNQTLSAKAIYETLAIKDVQAACDLFAAVYQQSNGNQGYVSIEIDPEHADNQSATIAEALSLWQRIQRPNIMIKIPATNAGIAAMSDLVAQGLNINMTLIFSRQVTLAIYRAYTAGLQQRLANNLAIEHIRVVASFFLSRIDSALDSILPTQLQGKVAIAIAKMAYQDWQNYFASNNFKQLAAAEPVHLLWASTGTKNNNYSDVLYIENLIGKQTVNTVPAATLNAYLDHGKAKTTINENLAETEKVLADIAGLAINIEELATRLQQEGLVQFEQAYNKILATLAG